MKPLPVDMAGLMAAFEDASWERRYFLDLETGEVLMFTEEFRYVEEPPAWPLPDWQQARVEKAKEVWAQHGTRYIEVPRADSHAAYHDMEDFIATVEDRHLQELLWVAIEGRGTFRRFKDVLASRPGERERWFAFKDARLRQRVLDWLESEEVEPIIEKEPEWGEEEVGLPTDRELFLAETLAFVRDVARMRGVERIALLGSLATEEPEPKDVDLLVTVTDDMDLTPLAAAARRLRGHLQSHNLGADVFLADPRDNYLGRTCPWKRCGPGIRMSCDARNCGQRLYLHDDWDTVRLERTLVRRPPILLWPQVLARVPLPEDVEQDLIQPLLDEGIARPAGGELLEWAYEWEAEGRCDRCRRQVPVLQLGGELTLCANCLRQAANLLNLCEAHARGLPWTFEVRSDYAAGPVTWEDIYDGDGHFLFTLYARGAPVEPSKPEVGVYDQPGYHPFGYPGVEERDGYPDIVADAEALTLAHVAEACRLWLRAREVLADGPLVIENGPDTFTFAAPGALPVVTHHKETYAAEEAFEDQVTEYHATCGACGVQITSHEPQLARCPWCAAEMAID